MMMSGDNGIAMPVILDRRRKGLGSRFESILNPQELMIKARSCASSEYSTRIPATTGERCTTVKLLNAGSS